MNKPETTLEEIQVNVKVKLAFLWTSFMFLYLYVDHFHLYMPGKIDSILKGKVFVFEITPGFIFTALSLATIPMLMIFLSVSLNAKTNRLVNLVAASFHIPYMLFNLAGEAWVHMVFAAAVEVVLLVFIIRYAWKWPRIET